MNLIVGCSHVLGHELDLDPSYNKKYHTPEDFQKRNRFSTLLFKRLKLPHIVTARNGADNSWITYNAIKTIIDHNFKFDNVVIAWSGPTRIHKSINDYPVFFNTLHPGHSKEFLKLKFPNEYKEILKWEKLEAELFLDPEFYYLQNYHYINYLTLFLEKYELNFIYLKSIESDINLKQFTKNSFNLAFTEFYDYFKYPKAPGGHSLVEGHRMWSEHLYSNTAKMFKKTSLGAI